ncbi:MAG TPA: ribosome biogenesis GTPase Der [Candidatus Binatia bacterium]|nr:ribosome biogenesis GTPase Der [Candidatus Binatia bacterium]
MANPAPLSRPAERKLPVVAIVGRPNVGKSTLFNRLIGERKAIVDDVPGVTRDRNYGAAEWGGRPFVLIDTGGFDRKAGGHLERRIQEQSRLALSEADVVLFLFDGKAGLNPLDEEAVRPLRKVNKPVLFVVNKLDSSQRAQNLYEFYALGLERLYSISAEHGLGIAELLDSVVEQFPADAERGAAPEREGTAPLRIAVVGRPNVGKSTLINRLLGFDRSVVDPTPGTTRDALEAPFELKGAACTLVDTAGIRRKARIHDRVERFSVNRSLRSVDRGDLVIHLLDGPEGVTDQDAQILSYGFERGKALLVAVNKWDLVAQTGATAPGYRDEVYYRLPFLDFVPVVFISAATGYGVEKMLATAAQVIKVFQRKISTSVFNQILQETVRAHPAALSKGKPVKFYYGTQTGSRPPTFTLFVNSPRAVPESYRRYLVHQLRQHLGLQYAPVRLILRARREQRQERRS